MSGDYKNHWENIYKTKQPHEVSWTQDAPKTSLYFIRSFNLPKSAAIIDIGGGDSKLVDFLIEDGYYNITVLGISEHSLNKAKQRLGDKAEKVKWIVSNITDFSSAASYDLWYDRAAFHFLTAEPQAKKYVSIAREAVKDKGFLTIATFSTSGPKKCSGLEIKQYSEVTLTKFENGFKKLECITQEHLTPFNTPQNFLFCSFQKHTN